MKYVLWHSEDRFLKSIENKVIEIGTSEEAYLFEKYEADALIQDMIANPKDYNFSWSQFVLLGDYALEGKEKPQTKYKTRYLRDLSVDSLQAKLEMFLNSDDCRKVISVSHTVEQLDKIYFSCLITYKGLGKVS